MKCFNIIIVTLLFVAISLVNSNETGNLEASNRITRGAKGELLPRINIRILKLQ